MPDTYKRSELTALLARYGLTPSKKYGQNFLTDKNIIDKIADAAGIQQADTVLEIGPGLGALTQELARRAGRVIAVEIDRHMIPALEDAVSPWENVEIVQGDFLKYDLTQVPQPFKVLGNLPYYITTPILMKMLEKEVKPALLVVMVQKEVAQRILHGPGSREYGAVSVAVGYRAKCELVCEVSREVFFPRPQVDSAVLRITPQERAEKPLDEALFFSVVKAGFGQRRKMLANALKTLGYTPEVLAAAFETAGVLPAARAETLGIEEFIALANALSGGRAQ
jgi:16S rRNA (adenine1518-N6/adenine1519-N6)-dimethyltransferase